MRAGVPHAHSAKWTPVHTGATTSFGIRRWKTRAGDSTCRLATTRTRVRPCAGWSMSASRIRRRVLPSRSGAVRLNSPRRAVRCSCFCGVPLTRIGRPSRMCGWTTPTVTRVRLRRVPRCWFPSPSTTTTGCTRRCPVPPPPGPLAPDRVYAAPRPDVVRQFTPKGTKVAAGPDARPTCRNKAVDLACQSILSCTPASTTALCAVGWSPTEVERRNRWPCHRVAPLVKSEHVDVSAFAFPLWIYATARLGCRTRLLDWGCRT